MVFGTYDRGGKVLSPPGHKLAFEMKVQNI
jgi:hypothetical protein